MKLTSWGITIGADRHWEVKRRDGRYASQVRALVRTSSKKKAAELLGTSLYEFNKYASDTGNPEQLAALDAHPPGTVLLCPDLHGDTIGGQKGYVVRP